MNGNEVTLILALIVFLIAATLFEDGHYKY